MGAITPTVRVAAVPAADETPVVAAPLRRPRARGASCSRPGRPARRSCRSTPAAPRGRDASGCSHASARPTCTTRDGRRPVADGVPAPADTAAIVVTSGTTGDAERRRADARRHGGDGPRLLGRARSPDPSDRWLACLPLHHVASLGVLARAYVTGVPWTVHDGFDLDRVARAPRAEGTTIVSRRPDRRCAACSTRARRCTSTAA